VSKILYQWILLLNPICFLWNIIFTFYYTRVRPQCDYSILGRMRYWVICYICETRSQVCGCACEMYAWYLMRHVIACRVIWCDIMWYSVIDVGWDHVILCYLICVCNKLWFCVIWYLYIHVYTYVYLCDMMWDCVIWACHVRSCDTVSCNIYVCWYLWHTPDMLLCVAVCCSVLQCVAVFTWCDTTWHHIIWYVRTKITDLSL